MAYEREKRWAYGKFGLNQTIEMGNTNVCNNSYDNHYNLNKTVVRADIHHRMNSQPERNPYGRKSYVSAIKTGLENRSAFQREQSQVITKMDNSTQTDITMNEMKEITENKFSFAKLRDCLIEVLTGNIFKENKNSCSNLIEVAIKNSFGVDLGNGDPVPGETSIEEGVISDSIDYETTSLDEGEYWQSKRGVIPCQVSH
jgi:hypothetical protein